MGRLINNEQMNEQMRLVILHPLKTRYMIKLFMTPLREIRDRAEVLMVSRSGSQIPKEWNCR